MWGGTAHAAGRRGCAAAIRAVRQMPASAATPAPSARSPLAPRRPRLEGISGLMARTSRAYLLSHALDRARERYGLELTTEQLDRLAERIRTHRTVIRTREGAGRTHHVIAHDGLQLLAVYDAAQGRIRTFLPNSRAAYVMTAGEFEIRSLVPRRPSGEWFELRCTCCGWMAPLGSLRLRDEEMTGHRRACPRPLRHGPHSPHP